jgi:prepilin-type N-terminal cleavage/methylation domain-containing protein
MTCDARCSNGSRALPLPHNGFSIAELMIVVSIIGLLVVLAIPGFSRSRLRSQATITLAEVRLIDDSKNQFALENRKPGDFLPKVADIKPYIRVGSRLYNTTQLSNFRDMFGQPIQMGDLKTLPLIDDATRDFFAEVITNNHDFWGGYCR